MFLLKQSVRLIVLILPIKTKFVSKRYSHLQGLNLADKSADGSKTIEILVGLDYHFEFITGEIVKDKFGEPVALKSSFGYILSRQYKNHSTVNFNETHFLKSHTKTGVSFRQRSFNINVKHLFNEAYYDESMKERSSLITEFQSNLKHNGSRYEVKLPFIGETKTLPDNYLLAKTRTGNLLKQLTKDDNLLKNYDTIFKEYLQEGIIEKASNIPNEGYVHYSHTDLSFVTIEKQVKCVYSSMLQPNLKTRNP